MNDLLVCCNPCGCESLVVLDGNAIWITLIICITIIAAILLILYKPSNKEGVTNPNKTDKDNQTAQQKKEELTPEEKEKKEEKEKEEKKEKEFLDYCYKMAKSLEEGNEEQRKDCWKILLHNHADFVPGELKKEELTPEEKEEKEKKEKEEKKKKEFLDYCYKMAKSLEEGNEEQRKDCWKILLHNHADFVPDELKITYKVGKNVAGNVSKTE